MRRWDEGLMGFLCRLPPPPHQAFEGTEEDLGRGTADVVGLYTSGVDCRICA